LTRTIKWGSISLAKDEKMYTILLSSHEIQRQNNNWMRIISLVEDSSSTFTQRIILTISYFFTGTPNITEWDRGEEKGELKFGMKVKTNEI